MYTSRIIIICRKPANIECFEFNKQSCSSEAFLLPPHINVEIKARIHFSRKKKKLAQFPKQKPHLHQIWRCWAPDIHSRHQTEELLSLSSQIAVWLQFLVICDLVEQRTPPPPPPPSFPLSVLHLSSIHQNKHICP